MLSQDNLLDLAMLRDFLMVNFVKLKQIKKLVHYRLTLQQEMFDYDTVASRGAQTKMDIGEKLAFPLLPYIPQCIKPNMISALNHAVNLCIFCVAMQGISSDKRWWFLLAAILTGCTTILDCLDGMLARGRGQSSPLGAVIDHGNDGMHVPLIAGTICVVVGVPFWFLVLIVFVHVGMYHIQLLSDKHFNFFGDVSGAEAEVIVMCMYLLCALVPELNLEDSIFIWLLTLIMFISLFQQCQQFGGRFGWDHWFEFGTFAALNLLISIPYITGAFNVLSWVWVVSLLSYRTAFLLVLEKMLGSTKLTFVHLEESVCVSLLAIVGFLASPESLLPNITVVLFTIYVYAANIHSVWTNYTFLRHQLHRCL
jgi:phosphatidylglycerophosphate synthase